MRTHPFIDGHRWKDDLSFLHSEKGMSRKQTRCLIRKCDNVNIRNITLQIREQDTCRAQVGTFFTNEIGSLEANAHPLPSGSQEMGLHKILEMKE